MMERWWWAHAATEGPRASLGGSLLASSVMPPHTREKSGAETSATKHNIEASQEARASKPGVGGAPSLPSKTTLPGTRLPWLGAAFQRQNRMVRMDNGLSGCLQVNNPLG